MTVLETLAERAKERAAMYRRKIPFSEMRAAAESHVLTDRPFLSALSKPGLSIIAEVKKASPSKGSIDSVFDYLSIAREYEEGGADCISCLTEPTMFMGSDSYLEEVSSLVAIPVLRKDFIVDPYMIYQARVLSASAILLIASILSFEELREFGQIAESLGLSALYEAHDEKEIDKVLESGAKNIGINNRNLKSFEVNKNLSRRLIASIPDEIVSVSESGITTADEAVAAFEAGFDGVLVGESLMRSVDRKTFLRVMKNGKCQGLRNKA